MKHKIFIRSEKITSEEIKKEKKEKINQKERKGNIKILPCGKFMYFIFYLCLK